MHDPDAVSKTIVCPFCDHPLDEHVEAPFSSGVEICTTDVKCECVVVYSDFETGMGDLLIEKALRRWLRS